MYIFSTCCISGDWRQDRRQQTFAAKGQIVKTLGPASHMMFVTAMSQLFNFVVAVQNQPKIMYQ